MPNNRSCLTENKFLCAMHFCLLALSSVVSWCIGEAVAASSMQYFTNTTLHSKELTLSCANAVTASLQCDSLVKRLLPGHYYDQKGLSQACTSSCDAALSSWQSSVNSACAGQSYQETKLTSAPIAQVPDLLRYSFNLTCLQANREFCNVLAHNASIATSQTVGTVTGIKDCYPFLGRKLTALQATLLD